MSEVQYLLGVITTLADVMRRSDAEIAQGSPATDEEWDSALAEAAQALLKAEGRGV